MKILVLGDEYEISRGSILPNGAIGCASESGVAYMGRTRKKIRQGDR